MTLEQYKEQVFKYDGEAKPITIGEIWDELPRGARRAIEREVKKGKNPDVMDFWGVE